MYGRLPASSATAWTQLARAGYGPLALALTPAGFDPEEIIPSCFLGMYAALAALEAGLDFCMGEHQWQWGCGGVGQQRRVAVAAL